MSIIIIILFHYDDEHYYNDDLDDIYDHFKVYAVLVHVLDKMGEINFR